MSEQEIKNIAIAALKTFNSSAKNVNVFTSIPNMLGGTLCLCEFNGLDEGIRDYTEGEEYGVLVRSGNGEVFPDYKELLKMVPNYKPSWMQQVASAQFVLFLVTIFILVSSIVAYFIYKKIEEPLSAALSSVLGFWLGRTTPKAES